MTEGWDATMPTNKSADKNKSRNFGLKYLPMDLARIVCSCLIPVFRMKRVTPDGEKYTHKIKGGAIAAANHTSFGDPFMVGIAFWYRRMFFLAAEAVMKNKLIYFLLRGAGCIKVERSIADIEAIKKCVGVLKKGHLLGVFPQGGIDNEENLDKLKSGAILMSMQADVPIIPMYLCPRQHWYTRRTVVIGETIYPNRICTKKMPSTKDISEITDLLMAEMNRCKMYNSEETK